MKNLKDILVKESRTGDLFQTVADCINDPKNVTDSDVKKVIKIVQKIYGFELKSDEAKSMIDSIIKEFPDMLENNY